MVYWQEEQEVYSNNTAAKSNAYLVILSFYLARSCLNIYTFLLFSTHTHTRNTHAPQAKQAALLLRSQPKMDSSLFQKKWGPLKVR